MAQWNKNTQEYLPHGTSLFEVVMIADEDGNPINSFGAASNIPIAGGQIEGYNYIHKFGANTTLSNQDFETIWDGSNLYPWATMDTAATTLTTNAETGNNGAEITIQGLNENWELTTEVLTLDGTAQTTQNSWKRVFRAFVSGSQEISADFTLSKGATLVLKIGTDAQQTLMSVYTIPAGKTGYLLKIQGSMDKSNAPVKFKLFARPFGNGFNLKGQWGTQGGNSIDYDYPVPLVFTEKTDIRVDVTTGGTCGNGAIFDLILVDNG